MSNQTDAQILRGVAQMRDIFDGQREALERIANQLESDAKLIAAVPEMAEVLCAVVTAIMVTPRSEMDATAWRSIADHASAALAKAGL